MGKSTRVLGPYREGERWRLVIIQEGHRTSRKTATKKEAQQIKAELERFLESRGSQPLRQRAKIVALALALGRAQVEGLVPVLRGVRSAEGTAQLVHLVGALVMLRDGEPAVGPQAELATLLALSRLQVDLLVGEVRRALCKQRFLVLAEELEASTPRSP